MHTYELISIGLYMLLMILIGIYSYHKSTSNSEEFLIGGRKMGAAVTALSAGAADMSGWLLMGLPGALYTSGLSSSWIAIGLTIGAYLNYMIVAPRIRAYTAIANNSITIPVFFENRFKDKTQSLKLVSSVFILVFFTLYTAAGMVSGGRLLYEFCGGPIYFPWGVLGGESHRFCSRNNYGNRIGDNAYSYSLAIKWALADHSDYPGKR